MTPLEPHALAAPQGFDIALIQAQCVARALTLPARAHINRPRRPPPAPHRLACLAFCLLLVIATMYRGSAFHDDGWHLPMILALTFSTFLKLQGLTKSNKDAR